MPTPAKPQPSVNTDLLAKRIETLLVKDHVELLQNKPRDLWGSFVRGAIFGLGSVIGATLMVTVLLFVLQQLGAIPWIGQFFRDLSETLKSQ